MDELLQTVDDLLSEEGQSLQPGTDRKVSLTIVQVHIITSITKISRRVKNAQEIINL